MTNGHFVGTSGIHINTYVNKDALYTHPEKNFSSVWTYGFES